MKKLLLLLAFLGLGVSSLLDAKPIDKAKEEELLRKSVLGGLPMPFQIGRTSFPMNFSETTQQNNPKEAAISTGYYWIDNREVIPPKYSFLPKNMVPAPKRADTTYQSELWYKIVPGPRIFPKSYWTNNPEGYPFFRQPADGDFWNSPKDSTDEAIAGPIPIGIRGGFYFNGIRYDSFYVSTNGLIALTNRRYFYDQDGKRIIPAGATSCYDPMSMDWFAGGVRGHDTLFNFDEFGNKTPVKDANGNIVYKDGLNDPVPDNFGYQFSVLGQDPTNPTGFNATVTTNGIRSRAGDFESLNDNCKAAVIGVFWGDMILSQWDANAKKKDEHARTFYKRTYTSDSLIIAFFNAQPKGSINTSMGAVTIDPDIRPLSADNPDIKNYITADANVVLTSRDSSITVHFSRLTDGINTFYRKVYGTEIFRFNTACGVRGFARHTNFGKGGLQPNQPWAGEYEQKTIYYQKFAYVDNTGFFEYPEDPGAVKFKQWQNTLRVADIQYKVRSKDPNAIDPDAFVDKIPSTEVEDYELLAGHQRLGAIQPIVLVQNLTNEIQGPSGVNFVKQDVSFRGRFLITNVITNRPVYNRLVPVDALCMGLVDTNTYLCNGDPNVRVQLGRQVTVSGGNYTFTPETKFKETGFNGVPPYYFAQIQFPPFLPNEFLLNNIGRMKATITVEPINPTTQVRYKDFWPWDDEQSATFTVLTTIYDKHPNKLFQNFEDDGELFHIDTETGDYIPSAWRWVNVNAAVVEGDQVSKYPLPPRRVEINANYWSYDREGNREMAGEGGTPNPFTLRSPVILMNRITLGNGEPLPKYKDKRGYGGDELRSFPIDLLGKPNPILTLSVQRTIHRNDWVRGYSDKELIGPEPRVVYFNPPNPSSVYNQYTNGMAVSAQPDELVVEYAKPTSDQINDIVNIPAANWRHLPFRRGTKTAALTDQAALTLYGAGGYLIAFLESDKDSILALPAGPDKLNSLRADLFDDGFDWDYKKFALPIPDTFLLWKNGGAKYFRFRIKVYATNDQKCMQCVLDDTDDFLVDNVKILYRSEVTDLEVTSVKVKWPYTIAPASQATAIPITVRVSNNTDITSSSFLVQTSIYRVNQLGEHLDSKPIYCRLTSVPNLMPSQTVDLEAPKWNARRTQTSTKASYRIYSRIIHREPDLIGKNDSTYSDLTLSFGQNFAYDPETTKPVNSVPDFLYGARGLNFLLPTNPSGQPRAGGTPGWDRTIDEGGMPGGNGSGNIAVKFELQNSDTLKGFSVFWAAQNQSADQITFRLYEGGVVTPGQNVIATIVTQRGGPNYQNVYNRYVDYYFSKPLVLEKGIYWVGISQDGSTGYELAGSSSRAATRTTLRFLSQSGVLGESGITLNLDKNFRKVVQSNLVNDNFFAFQNIANSTVWQQFTPSVGNIAFGRHNADGLLEDPGTQSLTRGTFIPMIRPYFGDKSFGEAVNSQDEYDTCRYPVSLADFRAKSRKSGVDLYWQTASEDNNFGFYIERRAEGEFDFQTIGFVAGNGTSSMTHNYNYTDTKVNYSTTYQYRLRQVDRDGGSGCTYSNIFTVTTLGSEDVVLEQNYPNPVSKNTVIKFSLPSTQNVRLDIIDIYGKVVNTLVNGSMTGTIHYIEFNANDSEGNVLANGNYIYRLTTESGVFSGKMSIYR